MYFGDRAPLDRAEADGFRLIRFFPAQQGWPIDYAPFRALLNDLHEADLPVMVERSPRQGDITALDPRSGRLSGSGHPERCQPRNAVGGDFRAARTRQLASGHVPPACCRRVSKPSLTVGARAAAFRHERALASHRQRAGYAELTPACPKQQRSQMLGAIAPPNPELSLDPVLNLPLLSESCLCPFSIVTFTLEGNVLPGVNQNGAQLGALLQSRGIDRPSCFPRAPRW